MKLLHLLQSFKNEIIVKKRSSFNREQDLDIYLSSSNLKFFLKSLRDNHYELRMCYQYKNREFVFLLFDDAWPYFKRIHIQVGGYYVNGVRLRNFFDLENNKVYLKKYGLYFLNDKYLTKLKESKSSHQIRGDFSRYLKMISLFFSRRPITIAFMGVDGAGKSSLIGRLNETLTMNFRTTIRYMGWKDFSWFGKSIYFFSRKKKKETALADIGENKHYSPEKVSFIYLLVYYVELWIRYIGLFPDFLKGKIIIFDRYFYDKLMVLNRDSLEFKFFKFITPIPSYLFVIDADVDTILSRKKEFNRTAIEKKRYIVLNFSKAFNNSIIISNNHSVELSNLKVIKILKKSLLNKIEIININ